tara:strand:+ start:4869 stop:5429 length:561 start_codon:yes stop_codon:yes gene_type:complete
MKFKMQNKNFRETKLRGVFEISIKAHSDSRGLFTNIFRKEEEIFQFIWGKRSISQVNISRTNKKGTIRGMHFQISPNSECKIIKCIKGSVFDVAVDLRKSSSSFGDWIGVELSSKKNNALVIPEGFAHGFQVLEENSELLYMHSGDWVPNSEKGIKWDDPKVNIKWPLKVAFTSEKDQNLPTIDEI